MLIVEFERFVKAHRRCGALFWDMDDDDDGWGVKVKARCLGCDATFLHSASVAEVTSAVVHSQMLTSRN